MSAPAVVLKLNLARVFFVLCASIQSSCQCGRKDLQRAFWHWKREFNVLSETKRAEFKATKKLKLRSLLRATLEVVFEEQERERSKKTEVNELLSLFIFARSRGADLEKKKVSRRLRCVSVESSEQRSNSSLFKYEEMNLEMLYYARSLGKRRKNRLVEMK